ncbi:MAG: AMP-dependent synthetase/ligase [Solirubrobacteraceae bacterium]
MAAALAARTMCEALLTTAAERPDQVALRTPDDSPSLTYAQALERVEALAAGLHGLGVRRGDTVGLMMVNRPGFHLFDAAAMMLGACPFSLYNTSPAEDIGYVMGDAGNRIVICEQQFLGRLREANEHGAGVETFISIDGGEDSLGIGDVVAAAQEDFDFEASWRAVEPSDLLTLIYTSGTTGPPKGVELTHANILAELNAVHALVPTGSGGRQVSFLPAAHIADRWASHYSAFMTYGNTVTSVAALPDLFAAVAQVRPTVFGAVPRVWEKLKAGLEAKGVTAETPGDTVRQMLGFDQVEWFVTGAAPTPKPLLEFFDALGIRICEVWGMSETSCVVTTNTPERWRPGSVGVAAEGMELRLESDGELLVRGPLIMRGYRNQPEKTAETIDEEGWLRTGDIAKVDEDGFWWIVDRKKELIINAAGKNMSPANIEAQLKAAGPLIGQAAVIGDRRPYNVALLVLDPDADRDGDVEARVRAEVDAANEKLARVEQIKRFKILEDEWLPGGDELTPTMKLKRRPIAEKYAQEIDTLYA